MNALTRFYERSRRWPLAGQLAFAALIIVVALLVVSAFIRSSDDSTRRTATPAVTTTLPASTTTTPTTTAAAATTTAPGTTPAPQDVPAAITPLVIAEPTHVADYHRDLFGNGWTDANSDCQDTRAEVLITESTVPVTYTPSLCAVVTGDWTDPWSGTVTTTARALDTDHTVPLANAWRSGAWAWTPAQRIEYANDLDFPDHLIAIPASENRAKGDDGPEAWRPPNRSAWCRYAQEWTAIKARWNLTASPQEWSAIIDMAASC